MQKLLKFSLPKRRAPADTHDIKRKIPTYQQRANPLVIQQAEAREKLLNDTTVNKYKRLTLRSMPESASPIPRDLQLRENAAFLSIRFDLLKRERTEAAR